MLKLDSVPYQPTFELYLRTIFTKALLQRSCFQVELPALNIVEQEINVCNENDNNDSIILIVYVLQKIPTEDGWSAGWQKLISHLYSRD